MKNKSERALRDRPALPSVPMLQAMWFLGEDSMGKGGDTGASQDAAFTGKGGGLKEEEGKRTLKKCCEMVAAADLGLKSEEENSVPTELVHYLSCN